MHYLDQQRDFTSHRLHQPTKQRTKMSRYIRGRVLALTALVYMAFSAICSQGSAAPSGEFATFCCAPEPSEKKNRTQRQVTNWSSADSSQTSTLLRAALTRVGQFSRIIKFHLAVRDTREPISLERRVVNSCANQLAVVNPATGHGEGGSRLAAAEKLGSHGQREAIWSCLSSRGDVRPHVALADSCA
jgi:hypothetical protein